MRPFVEGWRLLKMPARQERRRAVLQYIVRSTFQPGEIYSEVTVSERLRTWCEGGESDHVTVRRYLIDLGLMSRADGQYWVSTVLPPEPNAAERAVTALGLD